MPNFPLEGSRMKLSREEVMHIATLARLGLTEAELERFGEQLSSILENFEVLQQVDTEKVPPTAQSIDLLNVLRADAEAPSYPQEQILANAPYPEEGCFRVKAILE
jgi:aspartyl-tRNA(Asn)/glutamyl-tRNA(Gln) amidotransferase subunit C